MTSAQEPGVLKFYRITPSGSKIFLYGNNIAALGPSGSADGVIGSTPEKWLNLSAITSAEKILQVNDKLHITFTADSADTTDASDCEFSIPITYQNGSQDTLGSPDDSNYWDVFQLGDVALIAGREYPVCEKTVRQPFALGGGKIFASIEDDTA